MLQKNSVHKYKADLKNLELLEELLRLLPNKCGVNQIVKISMVLTPLIN